MTTYLGSVEAREEAQDEREQEERQAGGRAFVTRDTKPGVDWRRRAANLAFSVVSLDDEILVTGFGPKKAHKLRDVGKRGGNIKGLTKLFRRAQRKVENRHLRDRSLLLHHEKQRKKMHRELGQDPYLDTPS